MIHLLLVMAGGAAGSALRYGVSAALSAVPSLFPWSTILVNIVGSFVLGFVSGSVGTPLELQPNTRMLLGTGLCGGFTTYSAFAVESVVLAEQRAYLMLGTYIICTLVGGAMAAWGGVLLCRSISTS
jgi:CrcB protein